MSDVKPVYGLLPAILKTWLVKNKCQVPTKVVVSEGLLKIPFKSDKSNLTGCTHFWKMIFQLKFQLKYNATSPHSTLIFLNTMFALKSQ